LSGSWNFKQKRAEVTAKIENYSNSIKALLDAVDQKEIKLWCGLIHEKLLDQSGGFSKEYLPLMINQIELNGNEVNISGDSRSLAGAIKFAVEKKNPTTENSYRIQ
jgi:hypothetical protein